MDRQFQQNRSKYPLREVGAGAESQVLISEEERSDHVHVIGTTGEGKSKFIESFIRGDIKAGNGVCLLDPTDRGETCYNIVRYCHSIGFEKVCLIDPHLIHSHDKLSCIQPFNRKKSYRDATVANVSDTMRVLFQTKDSAETPRLQRYLTALINVLLASGMTMHEALYFSDYSNPHYQAKREEIFKRLDVLDRHYITIYDVFRPKAYHNWQQFFSSTINRLEPYFDSTLELMFGSDEGIPFDKMITEGWVILVNLYSGLGFEPIHTRLLGTTVINEIIFALDRLRNHGWEGVYYLYIDEAGRYANRNLADLLAHKRKSGLRVTVAHQYFKQFEDAFVLDAVKQLCKTKVMFNTPDYQDRVEMMKALGYGNDIPHDLAAFANKNLPKQTCVITKGKDSPVRVKIVEVPNPPGKWTPTIKNEVIDSLLSNPWNKTPDDVRREFDNRFAKPSPSAPRAGKGANRPAGRNPVWDKAAGGTTPPKPNGRRRSTKKS